MAVSQYRAIAELANQNGDRAIHHTATLLETMVHLNSTASEALENAGRSMAAAWTHQFDNDAPTELRGLAHLLDVGCSLRRNNNDAKYMSNKVQAMQAMLDETIKKSTWNRNDDILAIPIPSSAKNPSDVVSTDTSAIIGVGEDGYDHLLLSFLSQRDVYVTWFVAFQRESYHALIGQQLPSLWNGFHA